MPDFSTDQTANQSNNEQTTDQLTFKVGEREYSAEAAATKIAASDEHINRIEAENAEIRASLEAVQLDNKSRMSVEEALKQLQNPAETQESQTHPSTEGMSVEQIGEIASKQLKVLMDAQTLEASEQAAKDKALSTFESTKGVLEKQFGDKTEEVMNTKAKEMGVSIDHLITLASDPVTSSLLLQSMKVRSPVTQANPSSSFNTSSLGNVPAPSDNPTWYKGSSTDIMKELQSRRQNL